MLREDFSKVKSSQAFSEVKFSAVMLSVSLSQVRPGQCQGAIASLLRFVRAQYKVNSS